jgi:hypothetical protein
VSRDTPSFDDLEFVRTNATTAVRLGSGQRITPSGRLPLDAGIHLVAGKARRGGVRSIATVPEGEHFLSADGRWLGILDPVNRTDLALYDTTRGQRGFCFEVPWPVREALAVHPTGEMVASRHDGQLQVLLPDGQVLLSAEYPVCPTRRFAGGSYQELIRFSPCGQYLWFAYTPPDEMAVLLLLRWPTLEVLDSCAPPFEVGGYYERENTWWEVSASVSPATGHLAVMRQAGSTFLTLDFYKVRGDRIVHLPEHIYRDDLKIEDPSETGFAPDGARFVAQDLVFTEFSFPDCSVLAQTVGSDLIRGDGIIEAFGYSGNHILVAVEGDLRLGAVEYDLRVLRSGDLKASVKSLGPVQKVLANGHVLTPGEGGRQLQAFALEGEPLDVVAELDSERNDAVGVYHRKSNTWTDITAEVGWVELNFELATY